MCMYMHRQWRWHRFKLCHNTGGIRPEDEATFRVCFIRFSFVVQFTSSSVTPVPLSGLSLYLSQDVPVTAVYAALLGPFHLSLLAARLTHSVCGRLISFPAHMLPPHLSLSPLSFNHLIPHIRSLASCVLMPFPFVFVHFPSPSQSLS